MLIDESGMIFKDEEHRSFYYDNLAKCKKNDEFHRALIYAFGISIETRYGISDLFDFSKSHIKPSGLEKGWQTSGTLKISRLAFNLWNGRADTKGRSTPDELFACEFAPYFVEAIKLRHPGAFEAEEYYEKVSKLVKELGGKSGTKEDLLKALDM